jgi:predicted RNase H-like HicB family nuclease
MTILMPNDITNTAGLFGHRFTSPYLDVFTQRLTNSPSTPIPCLVYLIQEEDGGYSVIAANLPGAASQGDSEAEALANIEEAMHGLIESYRESSQPIPWTDSPKPRPAGVVKEQWVLVHA